MLPRILERMSAAAHRVGRDPTETALVAVTKGRTVGEIEREVLRYGHHILGENRVQEWRKKAFGLEGVEWHLIGNLQRNKVKYCTGAHLIHSLNSRRLADALEAYGEKRDHLFRTLIEVNVSGEVSKQGVDPEGAPELLHYVRSLDHVTVEGLMCMAPYHPDPEAARPSFRTLRVLGERLKLDVLSMGMSSDFEVAIEEGSTLVRVGSALFE